MRKLILALIIVTFITGAKSQNDYISLLSEGKVWHETADYGAIRMECEVYLDGDTIIDGDTYRKLYERSTIHRMGIDGSSAEVSPHKLRLPVMEEGKRVYAYLHSKRLLYDFTMQVGDSLKFSDNEWVKVNAIDTIAVGDMHYRRFHLTQMQDKASAYKQMTGKDLPEGEPRIECEETYWVEGIGSQKGLTSLFGWVGEARAYANMSILDYCLEDGACIFTEDDFAAPPYKQDGISGTRPATQTATGSSSTYDLQGHPLNSTLRPGIYIQQGRKRVVR